MIRMPSQDYFPLYVPANKEKAFQKCETPQSNTVPYFAASKKRVYSAASQNITTAAEEFKTQNVFFKVLEQFVMFISNCRKTLMDLVKHPNSLSVSSLYADVEYFNKFK